MGRLSAKKRVTVSVSETTATAESLSQLSEYYDEPGLKARISNWLNPLLLITGDYLAIILAILSAFYLRQTVLEKYLTYNGPFFSKNLTIFIIPLIYIALISYEDLYSKRLPFWQSSERLFKVCLYAAALIIGILYFFGFIKEISRIFIAFSLVFIFFFLLIERYFVKRLLIKWGLWQKPVLIIGTNPTSQIVAKALQEEPVMGYGIAGIIEVKSSRPDSRLLMANLFDLERVIKAKGVQQVILAAPELESPRILELIKRVQPHVQDLVVVPNLPGLPLTNLGVDTLFNQKILLLRTKNNLARISNRCFKILFDYLLGVGGLVLLLPVLLVLAALIHIDSPGPIIFGHRRIGAGGKSFICYKFRTMVVNADHVLNEFLAKNAEAEREWQDNFKLKNDPRITRVGRWLRKTSLDELPQLFNVLKGEMSLVGPRPIVKDEIAKYREIIDDYYLVRPGITGYWQINGRSDVDYETRVQMDSWYVRNWSMWLDIALICKTFKVVLERKGAY